MSLENLTADAASVGRTDAAEDPLVLLAGEEEFGGQEEWEADLMAAAGFKLTHGTSEPADTTTLETNNSMVKRSNLKLNIKGEAGHGSVLNTPVVDEPLAAPGFPNSLTSDGGFPPADVFPSIQEETVVEMLIPVHHVSPQEMQTTQSSYFEDLWTLGGNSPEANLADHAPLSTVEGRPESLMELELADALPMEEDEGFGSSPPNYDSTPLLSSGEVVGGDLLVPTEADLKVEKEDEAEVDNYLSGGNGLLEWIIDDTIKSDSDIPGAQPVYTTTIPTQPGHSTTSQPGYTSQLFYPATLPPTVSTINTDTWSCLEGGGEVVLAPEETTVNADPLSTPAPVVKKNRRGRPPVAPNRAITPLVPRKATATSLGRAGAAAVPPAPLLLSEAESDHLNYASSATDGNLTDQDIETMRYRRMRDLNNEASKRCRENRKRKFEAMEEEYEGLREVNVHLKRKLVRLEGQVARLKAAVTELVAGAAVPQQHQRL